MLPKDKHHDETHANKAERLKDNLSVHHTKKKKHKEKEKCEHHSSHKEKHQSKHHNHVKGKDELEKLSHKHKEHNSSSKKLSQVSYLNPEKLSETPILSPKNNLWLSKSASSESDISIISHHHLTHRQIKDTVTDSNSDKVQNLCNNGPVQQGSLTYDVMKSSEVSLDACDDSLSSVFAKDKTVESGVKRKFGDFVNTEDNYMCKKVKAEVSDSDSIHIKSETGPLNEGVNISDETSEKRLSTSENSLTSSDNDQTVRTDSSSASESGKHAKDPPPQKSSGFEDISLMVKTKVDCDSNSGSDYKNDLVHNGKLQMKQLPGPVVEKILKIEKCVDFTDSNKADSSRQFLVKSHSNILIDAVQKVDSKEKTLKIPQNSLDSKKVSDFNRNLKLGSGELKVKNESTLTSKVDKINSEKQKSDKSKHETQTLAKVKSKYLKPSDIERPEKEKHGEKKTKHHKDGKSHKTSLGVTDQNKKELCLSKDTKEKVTSKDKSHSSIKTELCLRCRQKLTSHRNVSIQCKRDRHDQLMEKVGVSQRIPRLPQGLDMRHLKYGKYIRLEVYPNGGAALLHLYWDEISHLHHKHLRALAEEFLKVNIVFIH